MAAGFQPGTNRAATDDEKRRLAAVQQIPTGGTSPAPPINGSENGTDLSRNVNNALNAMGGMGVMASVPLGIANRAAGLAPQLANPVAKLGMNAAPNFVAGMGSGATVAAAAPIAKAAPHLPGVNAALQEGAQANALAGATRSMAGASSALTAMENTQPAPVAPVVSSAPSGLPPVNQQAAIAATPSAPSVSPGAPSEYGRQMSAVGSALASMPIAALKTLVSAPGYGFNKDAAPSNSEVPSTVTRNRDVIGNPGTIAEQTKGMTQIAPAGQAVTATNLPAAPVNPNQITAARQPNGVMSFSGGPNIGKDGGEISYAGASGFKPSGAGVTVVPGGSLAGGSPFGDAALSAARLAAADRGDFQAVSDSYGGNFANGQYAGGGQSAYQRLSQQFAGKTLNDNGARALSDAYRADQEGRQQASTASLAQQKLGLDKQEFGLKKQTADTVQTAAGFTARSAKRIEDLQTAYEDAPAEGKSAIAEQLRVLTGKDKPAQWKALALQGGTDSMGNKTEGVLAAVNEQTGEVKRLDSQSSSGPAPLKNHVEALKKNPALAASFDQQYGKGAAAKIMGNK